MYQDIYDSAWHHPGISWGAGLLVLGLLAQRWLSSNRKHGFALIALTVFQLEIMLDALFTGAFNPLDSKSALSTTLAVVFVVLGDLRFFVLFERFRDKNARGWWWRALLWSLLIPVGSLPARWLWPGNTRALFLSYELMFAALAAMFLLLRVRHIGQSHAKRWLTALCVFELVQYLAWSSADIAILNGVEAGLLFRLVPNTIYYALFVPFALMLAPSEELA